MTQRWLIAGAAALLFHCSLEEYSPAVTVLRGDGPGDSASAGDGNNGDPNAGDPNTGDPFAGDPNAGDPNAGDPLAGDPFAGDPNAGDPFAGDPVVPPQSTQLNVDPVSTGDVSLFEVSPDGTKVVYLSDEETDDKWELYAVSLDGTNRVRINGTLPAAGDVVEFAFSADSQKVVYHADQRVNDMFELWASDIDGTNNVKLNPDLSSNRTIYKWAVSSDGHVVYRCDQDTNNVFELYSTTLDGGTNTKLNNTIVPAGGDVHKFMMSPDASLVVYWADEAVDTRENLYAVNPDGSNNRLVHDPFANAWQDAQETFFISPDNLKVAFRGDLTTTDVNEIYVATLDTVSSTVRLNADLVANGATSREVYFTPDSSRVVYRADQDTDEVWELYSIATNGTGRAKLHPALTAGHAVGSVGFLPNSSRILFTGDLDQLAVFELYAVNPDGTNRVKLNADFTFGKNIVRFAAAPDSSNVVYLANQDDANRLDLYAVTAAGTNRVRLTNFGVDRNVYNFQITADSKRVVFTADGDIDGVIELYAVGLDGSDLVRLNDAMTSGSFVGDFRLAGSHVVYAADQDTPGIRELYAKAGVTTPGGGFSAAPGGRALNDSGLLARYYLDEAAAGRSPTFAVDAAASPLNLPVTWDANMAYIVGPGGRGLQWQRVDAPGTPTINVESTKLESSLVGSQTGTLEVVVDIDHDTESEPRFIYFGYEGSARAFCLLYDGPKKLVKFWFDYNVNSNALWWRLDLLGKGRHLLTATVDTTEGSDMNRVVLYVDGIKLPGFRETNLSQPALNATMVLSTDHDADPKTADVIYDFYIGNRTSGERSNDGRIYYAAVYDEALTDAEVYQNAAVLLHDDDTP